ncbi:MAG: hypothetical protein FD129_2613 [bacterium]|nr:MAG: hypothetical protein FD129_2613 [bacterium]
MTRPDAGSIKDRQPLLRQFDRPLRVAERVPGFTQDAEGSGQPRAVGAKYPPMERDPGLQRLPGAPGVAPVDLEFSQSQPGVAKGRIVRSRLVQPDIEGATRADQGTVVIHTRQQHAHHGQRDGDVRMVLREMAAANLEGSRHVPERQVIVREDPLVPRFPQREDDRRQRQRIHAGRPLEAGQERRGQAVGLHPLLPAPEGFQPGDVIGQGVGPAGGRNGERERQGHEERDDAGTHPYPLEDSAGRESRDHGDRMRPSPGFPAHSTRAGCPHQRENREADAPGAISRPGTARP